MGWSEIVQGARVRTADVLRTVGAVGVIRRLWVVFNGQLQWPAGIFDHTVDLAGRVM